LEPDALMEVDDDAKEDKLEAFLNDPEHATKVFLSSHMRKQGLIWYVFPPPRFRRQESPI
jgi:hypothetical protein